MLSSGQEATKAKIVHVIAQSKKITSTKGEYTLTKLFLLRIDFLVFIKTLDLKS